MLSYATSVTDVTPADVCGFCEGWRNPLSPDELLAAMRGSAHVVLALDGERVVGLITAISDGCHAAYIPLLEVLPAYRGRGVGTELVRRMLHALRDYDCVDLTCDPGLQPFYERCGLRRSVGMMAR